LAKGLEFYQQYQNNPRITATFAPHAPYTISDQTFIKIQERASELDVKINLHLHETLDEINQSLATYKKRPIKRLHDLGFLSSQVLAIHCANLNEEDLDIFCATQPSVIHCPESNMKLASGICPIEKLRYLDINVALGTDSVASNNDLDMLSEMRQASFLSKVSTGNSLSYKANETIDLATINGAKALGIDKKLGTLKKGKLADFIAINVDDIEMLPIYDPIAQVVYASNRNQVSDVWVGGKQLMKNRQLLTLDEQALKEKARKWGEKIRG
jgi:5-methylthioadenosine/S-adenosylhomocysteine deaminase